MNKIIISIVVHVIGYLYIIDLIIAQKVEHINTEQLLLYVGGWMLTV